MNKMYSEGILFPYSFLPPLPPLPPHTPTPAGALLPVVIRTLHDKRHVVNLRSSSLAVTGVAVFVHPSAVHRWFTVG